MGYSRHTLSSTIASVRGSPVVIIAGNSLISNSYTISSSIPPTFRPMLLALLYSSGTIDPRDSLRGIEVARSG